MRTFTEWLRVCESGLIDDVFEKPTPESIANIMMQNRKLSYLDYACFLQFKQNGSTDKFLYEFLKSSEIK